MGPVRAGGDHNGETAAAAVRASAGVPLCAAAGRVDRAVLSLTASQVREILPREFTISDAPRVRALAAALCALPPLPTGVHCPRALAGAVRLTFAAGGVASSRSVSRIRAALMSPGSGRSGSGRGRRFPGGC